MGYHREDIWNLASVSPFSPPKESCIKLVSDKQLFSKKL